MKALILAAGLGTRLRPLTETTPKPLVPINGEPLLKYHLDHLRTHGVTDVLINTHYLASQIEDFVANYNQKQLNDFRVSTIYEPELLGSAGTLKVNRQFFDENEPFLIVYSDNLTDIDYSKLLSHHKNSGNMVTIASYYEHFPEQKGIIEHNDTFQISKFVEKPKPIEMTSNYANAGIYAVNPEIFSSLAKLEQKPLDFGHHVFPFLLQEGIPMQVYKMEETLLDIGNLENYTKAQDLPQKMKFKQ